MALTLQACSGQPAKPAAERDLANSILKQRPLEGDLQCPSRYTRFCTGAGASLKCGCLTPDDLRRALGRPY
jgi:hypothetical protein